MKIQRYNPGNMSLAEDSLSHLDFGTVFQGNYCEEVLVIRPVATTETVLNEMKMFLQSKGPFVRSAFGVSHSMQPVSGVVPGTGIMTGVLGVVGNPHLSDNGGVSLSNGEYVWLDVKVGNTEKGSYPGVNYRFVFDYV